MAHPFVACLERELATRRATYAKAVREGRMPRDVARREYDRLLAVVDFLRAVERRYAAEARYEHDASDPERLRPLLEDMAQGDAAARKLWFEWAGERDDGPQHDPTPRGGSLQWA